MHLVPLLKIHQSLLHVMNNLTILEASTTISNNSGDASA